jgi:NAD+ synthase (glutamine-hydrolysing)
VIFMDLIEEMFEALVLGLKDYAAEAGFSKAVLGLSGGIDSSVVAGIAAKALGAKNVLGMALPSKFSSKESTEDAQALAANLGIDFKKWPIEEAVELNRQAYLKVFEKSLRGTADENPQARIRCNALMTISNAQNRLVLATGNRTEFALGYCTLYGDLCGGISVIADVNKTDVYRLADYINKTMENPIPKSVIEKTPSAELSPGQVDPFDYEKVSPLVDLLFVEGKSKEELIELGYSKDLILDLMKRIKAAEFKRAQAPPAIKLKP